jgi:transposase
MTQLEANAMSNRISTLEAEKEALSAENKKLQQQVAYLQKHLFGRKSEKTNVVFSGQIDLFDEAEQELKKKASEPELQTIKEHRRKKSVGQREKLIEDLPHEEKLYTLTLEERNCKRCGSELVSMGKELIRTEVEFIPAKLRIIDHVRETFECRSCRKENHFSIEKPVVPNPVIAHSLASASSIAHIMVQKYGQALPLYRQEKEWRDLGLELTRSTLASWIMRSSRDWLTPVVELLHKKLLEEAYLHADETTVQVMNEPNRKNTSVSYMWVYASGKYGAKHAIRIFEYQPGRNGKYPQEFLQGFRGYLHTDAYAAYNKVGEVTRCLCWSHVRRDFIDAMPKDVNDEESTLTKSGIEQINQLFYLEKEFASLKAEERKKQRLLQEKPVLEAFWLWIETNKGKVLPKSNLRKAMNYAENNKKGLEAFLEDGNCSLSNNLAENSIRPFTIGRKNWLFSGSPKGATASAAIYSLIETCKANGVKEYKYLKYLLETLPNIPFMRNPELLEDHLPWSEKIQQICK